MFNNNFKAVGIHITIGIISLLVFAVNHIGIPKWVSEEAARRHHNKMIMIGIILFIVALILYYFAGRIFLSKQGNKIRNFMSVSALATIGITIWLLNLAYVQGVRSQGHVYEWFYYLLYNCYSFFIVYEMDIGNAYILLGFTILPSLLLWLGLENKKEV